MQGRGGGLEAENREENNRVRCGWEIVGEIVMQKKPTDGVKYKNLRQTERQIKRKKLTFLYVVSPEASTLLWPIFFSWAGPTPNGDGICHKGKKGKCICILYGHCSFKYSPLEVYEIESGSKQIQMGREEEENGNKDRCIV